MASDHGEMGWEITESRHIDLGASVTRHRWEETWRAHADSSCARRHYLPQLPATPTHDSAQVGPLADYAA